MDLLQIYNAVHSFQLRNIWRQMQAFGDCSCFCFIQFFFLILLFTCNFQLFQSLTSLNVLNQIFSVYKRVGLTFFIGWLKDNWNVMGIDLVHGSLEGSFYAKLYFNLWFYLIICFKPNSAFHICYSLVVLSFQFFICCLYLGFFIL